ncbi:PilZ domain-containing protein [Aestuariivirga sp.]|uniref:PilZ domain-containing protein n=1 Tax=Aestuariivirga sp. TaxID=2650926 RepID=UPI0025B884E2|nr:PilZ domain-containing protein [Aestuariivirga sp.]MCA3555811.1 PilZ domain-containing protein [Aestuariivirga sp.]
MTQFGKRLAPAALSAALMPQSFPARLLLADGSERQCAVTAIDPDSALFLCEDQVPEGTPLAAFIEDIGRVNGVAGEAAGHGFWVNFSFSANRQPRFVRHLRWLIRRDLGLAAAERRHTRFEPRNRQARFMLPGGREQPCEVIDISLSGAGIRSRMRPSVGSPVTLGRMKGRVVRHFDDGFALEFLTPLERSDLDSALG